MGEGPRSAGGGEPTWDLRDLPGPVRVALQRERWRGRIMFAPIDLRAGRWKVFVTPTESPAETVAHVVEADGSSRMLQPWEI